MTDREKRLIEGYIPNPRDPDLIDGQYYYNHNGRIIKVFPLDILPHDEGIEYGCYQLRGGQLQWIDTAGYGSPCRGCRKANLYDNKQDCRDDTHLLYDNWEDLRRVQENG